MDPKTHKLAFCKENTAVHAYVDALEKLQVKLDGVDSSGYQEVRDCRKSAVVAIEKELQNVEQWKSEVIRKQTTPAGAEDADDDVDQAAFKNMDDFEEPEDSRETVW